jgi:glycerophosphoryl diester phosphodiesterase
MRALLVAAVVAALALPAAPAAVAKTIEIHAHRGGTVVDGRPAHAEETLDAYRAALRNGFVLEVDAKLTADRVPVAVHDASLDRTTNCTGEVRSFTLAALAACRPDVIGSPGSGLPTRAVSPRGSIPTIAEVLELARLTGAKVNLEIKNVPTDPDYDETSGYANRVMDVVLDSGLPRSQLLIQSFIPANLDAARQRLRRVPTSLLTLNSTVDVVEAGRAYDWLSPRWPLADGFVTAAHRAGHPVAPYTLNTRADVRAAARARVDAVITDDPLMAARALGRRPVRALTVKLRRRAGVVSAKGRLRPPRGTKRCSGRITLRVLGAKRALYRRGAPLAASCRYQVELIVPRGAPGRLLATVGFGGTARLLPRLVGPRPVPRETPLAVP